MSWLYAIVHTGNGNKAASPRQAVHGEPIHVVHSSKLYLAIGGNPDTCFYGSEPGTDRGWAVTGIGIRTSTDSRILEQTDWQVLMAGDLPQSSLDGHYVAVRWDEGKVECFTDLLGLRTLFFGKMDGAICLSTRLDWVAKTTGRSEIDFASFGSKWLMFNQLECESCISGIERLGPCGHVVFKDGRVIKHDTSPWLPEFADGDTSGVIDALSGLLRAAATNKRTISLGLSGGLDSRLLLSMLTTSREHRFGVHTFGDSRDPDVLIASAVTNALGIDADYYDDPIPSVEKLITMLTDFAAQTCVVEPASSLLKLRYYPALRYQQRLMLDGGFGEIARRQYLNRIVRLGRAAFLSKDVNSLLPLMRVSRGNLFNDDVRQMMERGCLESLTRLLVTLPSENEIGIENAVDLLAIRTRIPNYGAPEQARLDGDVMNFMPLAQPSFLKAVFSASISWRRNGRMFRKIIRTKNPQLAKFPLVKFGATYRFGFSTPAAWLVAKIKGKIGHNYPETAPDRFLGHIKEFVLDLAQSCDVGDWPAYDKKRIRAAVQSYYNNPGNEQRTFLDWWISFELWRRSLRK